MKTTEILYAAAERLREMASEVPEGPWKVYDMDSAVRPEHTVNPPGEGWWWVWRDIDSPYFQGVIEVDTHDPNCSQHEPSCCHHGAVGAVDDVPQAEGIARYLALWSPVEARLIASMLEQEADNHSLRKTEPDPHAVAVALARRILGVVE